MHPVQSAVIALGGVLLIAVAAFVGVRFWAQSGETTNVERLHETRIAELGPHLAGQRVALAGAIAEVQYREPGLQVLVLSSEGSSVEVPYLQTGGQIRVFQPGERYRVEGQVFADDAGVTVVPAGSRAVVRTRAISDSESQVASIEGGGEGSQTGTARLLASIDPGSYWVAIASVDMLEKAAAALVAFDAPEKVPGTVQPVMVGGRKRYRALIGPYQSIRAAEAARGQYIDAVPDAWILRASIP